MKNPKINGSPIQAKKKEKPPKIITSENKFRLQSEGSAQLFHQSNVTAKFPRRDAIYYSITESEINTYAQLGWIATFFLTFCGIAAGFASGAFIAIQQDGLTLTAKATINAVMWSSIVTGIVFLVISVYLIFIQQKNKKDWKSEGEID